MLIEIKKITDSFIKDHKGEKVPHPTKPNKFLKEEKVVEEYIDVFEIKAIRPFHRNGGQHKNINGEISVIYMKEPLGASREEKKALEIRVVSKCDELVKEVNELRSTTGTGAIKAT